MKVLIISPTLKFHISIVLDEIQPLGFGSVYFWNLSPGSSYIMVKEPVSSKAFCNICKY